MPLVYLATAYQYFKHRLKEGAFPQIIPPGGSSPLGVIGFINAAFELNKQISDGEIREPKYIYVACGTMGTAAGLILGLRAVNIKSQVVSVRVTSDKFVNTRGMLKLINNTNALLHSIDASFPTFKFSSADIEIRHDYFGKQYALFTKEGIDAVSLIKDSEGIKLEGTYTGKILAALIDDSKSGKLQRSTVLFWNTSNSRDFSEAISNLDYHDLPSCFHRYFEEAVQPLDSQH
jgi:D-cysteine desulfhydrase